MIPAAKEFHRNRGRLATEGDVVDRDTPQPGDMFITPRQTGRVSLLAMVLLVVHMNGITSYEL